MVHPTHFILIAALAFFSMQVHGKALEHSASDLSDSKELEILEKLIFDWTPQKPHGNCRCRRNAEDSFLESRHTIDAIRHYKRGIMTTIRSLLKESKNNNDGFLWQVDSATESDGEWEEWGKWIMSNPFIKKFMEVAIAHAIEMI